MTPVQFASYVRFNTKTNSTELPDSDIILLMNIWRKRIAEKVARADEDSLGMIQLGNLVADQREYPEPVDAIKTTKLEVKFDGTNWIPLEELDLNSYKRTTDETTILQNFSNQMGHAFFDKFRDSLWLYCGEIENVTNGIKYFTQTYPDEISSLAGTTDLSVPATTTSVAMPEEFHEVWAKIVEYHVRNGGDKVKDYISLWNKVRVDFQEALEDYRGKNTSRTFILSAPRDEGSNY